jgi:hypothetical protein
MAGSAVLAELDAQEKRRYIVEHAPGILRALIVRRTGTEPSALVPLAIETASQLYDAVAPYRVNGGMHIRVDPEPLRH